MEFPMSQSNPVLLRITQQDAQYTKTEKSIYKFFLEDTEYVLAHSITDIAKAIGVSEAAITRFAKKAGYKGFNEMRLLFTHGEQNSVKGASSASLVEGILSDYTTHLKDTAFNVNQELLGQFVSCLENGDRVKLYATGFLGDIAQAYAFRLASLGFNIAAYTDGYTISVDAVLTRKGDMVIGIDFTGESQALVFALTTARKRGARTAAATNFSDSSLAKAADVLQLLPSTELLPQGDMISPHIAVLFLADYYYSTLLMRNIEKYRHMDKNIRGGLGYPVRSQRSVPASGK